MDDTMILVIHVNGNEDRRSFIQNQLDKVGMNSHFILDGNVADLTPEILDTYFKGDMHGRYPRTSCAYKHLLAMQYVLGNHLEGALVVEDDLRFYKNFNRYFRDSLNELKADYQDEPLIVNYEESSLLFVPRSQRQNGRVLYPARRDRYTGCLYINREAAEVMMDYVKKNKIDVPFDRYHCALVEQGVLSYLWSHPCLACQCSCDGTMPTMIPTRPRPLKRLKWLYKRFYKHLLYFFR